jgi:dsRNA-specific ribonuclease
VEEINPISRLIQIQQAKKEKEPVYTLREERGMPRRREFVMEVIICSFYTPLLDFCLIYFKEPL